MLITVTPATAEPVTLAEAKVHLRQTHSADDALIERQITSSRETVEQWTGVALADAEYQWTPPRGRCLSILPLLPASVVAISTVVDDVREPYLDYTFDAVTGVLSGVQGSGIAVTFKGVPGVVPEKVKSAILALMQAEYEAQPADAEALRTAAYQLAFAYRGGLGA